VRTAIGFGFGIVEMFNCLTAMLGVVPALQPQMPRYVCLFPIGAGVLGLVISCAQYLWIRNHLWSQQFRPIAGMREGPMQTPAPVIAIALTLLGTLAFIAVLLRVP
jgi:hypothetical protein